MIMLGIHLSPHTCLPILRSQFFYDEKIDKNDEEKVGTNSSEVEEEMEDDRKRKYERQQKNGGRKTERVYRKKKKRLCTPASRHVKVLILRLTGKYLYTTVSNSYLRERMHSNLASASINNS